MDVATVWWVCFGVLAVAELTTGTFYLLMLALACVAGALGAHLGASVAIQVAIASMVGVALSAGPIPRKLQARLAKKASTFSLGDEGALVTVASIEQGVAKASHRGALWAVIMGEDGMAPLAIGDRLTVERVDGVSLVCRRSESVALQALI